MIYNGDLSDSTDIQSNSYLQVNSCGIQLNTQENQVTFRKKGRTDYHILYVCNGTVDAVYMNKKYCLSKGDFILYPPSMAQNYCEYQHSTVIWLHFNGYEAENILKEAQLPCGVYKAYFSESAEKLLTRLVSEHNRRLVVSNEKGILLSLIYTLGKIVGNADDTSSKINDCITFLTTNYNMDITVDEMARFCGLSTSRFLHLFKETVGVPPHAYLKILQINNAKVLLASTTLPIAEISRMSGYSDPLYFSRLFKKSAGMSPSDFRKHSKNAKH